MRKAFEAARTETDASAVHIRSEGKRLFAHADGIDVVLTALENEHSSSMHLLTALEVAHPPIFKFLRTSSLTHSNLP